MSTNEQPRPLATCPECNGQRIVASLLSATVGVMPKKLPTVGSVAMKERPKGMPKWLMKLSMSGIEEVSNLPFIPEAYRSKLEAIVCIDCGITTLRATDPRNLVDD